MRGTLVIAGVIVLAGWADAAPPDFDREVAPLLARRCLSCHSGDAPKGQLDLTRREAALRGGDGGPALVPGQVDASPLWQRVAADEMPPKHPLPAAEKQVLRDWLSAGAPWSTEPIDPLRYSSAERAGYDWWSLQPLQRAELPPDPQQWSRQPLDRFVGARLQAAGLAPADEAERRVLIRRLSFDLLGLPPTPDEVAHFVADPAPDAYEQLVERLLASPHYGERWARHWLDVVRFGESNGFERDLPRPNAWHYRDWLIDALNRDLPYDEFVRWQLAGDVLAPDDPAAAKALGFLVAGPHDTVVPVSDRMRQAMRQDELEDLVGTVGQTFLGLTVNCGRCHDHKFDPVSSKEYYQLAAALAGADHGEKDIVPPAVREQLAAWDRQIAELEATLRAEAEPLRAAIYAERSQGAAPAPLPGAPEPLAAWDFRRDLRDYGGALHGTVVGSGQPSETGFALDGKSFIQTLPLKRDLVEKTLEVRVRLADLNQRGGGALSVQTLDGAVFDAIVFGEQQPRRWMAGSDNFARTASFEGPEEAQAADEFVTIAIVYRADGTIAAFRNGQPYGRAYRSSGPVKFDAGKAQVVFGLRHNPPGGNRLLTGQVAAARLYARALSDAEVAASAASSGVIVTEADVLARLAPGARRQREQRSAAVADLRARRAELQRSGPFKVYTAATAQPGVMHILRRGNVADRGDVVAAAGLSALKMLPADFGLKPEAPEHQRRQKLAEWITDPRNALFARVMVNRLWHYHFGAGLVETPNDLGFNGGRPSHPELLDWLAGEFVSSGYRLKHLHRLLVTSATYRQSSAFRADAARVDAHNRLLWRMSPRRLDAESVRDAILVATGELNADLFGKGYSDFNSYFFKGTQFYDPLDPTGHESQRRTIYRMWARGGRSPFLDTFDCPDPSTTSPKRSATTTPLQALALLNHSFVLRMSEKLAARLEADGGDDPAAQVQRAYRLLFSRAATADEVRLCLEFRQRRGAAALCRGLLNASEFLYVD